MKRASRPWSRKGANALAACMAVVSLLSLAACGTSPASHTGPQPTPSATVPSGPAATPTPVPMTIMFTSPAFQSGKSIPAEYTCAGSNVSPPLAWGGAPQQTISFVMIMEDVTGAVYHWIVFNIPAGIHDLPANVPHGDQLANGARQGINDDGAVGYLGPCPALPRGSTDMYVFTIYALDTSLNLEGGASWRDVLPTINGHILAEGQFDGTFKLPNS